MKLNPEVFRVAAELNFLRSKEMTPELQAEQIHLLGQMGYLPSKYSCDNLMEAVPIVESGSYSEGTAEYRPYRHFYADLYEKDSGADSNSWHWWPNQKGRWDYESRILALLLAAEVAEDESEEA